MSEQNRTAERPAKVSLALAIAAFALFGASSLFSDTIFRANLATAIDTYEPGAVVVSSDQTAAADIPIVGSEDFWLGHANHSQNVNVSWSSSIAKGDKITIGSDGRQRMLKVESVDPIHASGVTRVDTESIRPLMMVTAREVGRPDGMVMRFVVEVEDPLIPTLRKQGNDTELSAL